MENLSALQLLLEQVLYANAAIVARRSELDRIEKQQQLNIGMSGGSALSSRAALELEEAEWRSRRRELLQMIGSRASSGRRLSDSALARLAYRPDMGDVR